MRASILFLAVLILAGCADEQMGPSGPDDSSNDKPFVAISTPQEGCVLDRGVYPIRVTAFHTSGIKFVRLKIGVKDIRLDYSAPFDFVWTIDEDADPEVSAGTYDICALAVDMNNNVNQHCIKVDVKY